MNIFFSTNTTCVEFKYYLPTSHKERGIPYLLNSIKRPRRLLNFFLIRVRRLFEGGVHLESNFLQTVIW